MHTIKQLVIVFPYFQRTVTFNIYMFLDLAITQENKSQIWLVILKYLGLSRKSHHGFSERKTDDQVGSWKLGSVEKMEQNHILPDTHWEYLLRKDREKGSVKHRLASNQKKQWRGIPTPQTLVQLTGTCSRGLHGPLFRVCSLHVFPPFWRHGYAGGTHDSNSQRNPAWGLSAWLWNKFRINQEAHTVAPPAFSLGRWTARRSAAKDGNEGMLVEQEKVTLHDRLRSSRAQSSFAGTAWIGHRAQASGPSGLEPGSTYWAEAYWHLCWLLTRSTGFRK